MTCVINVAVLIGKIPFDYAKSVSNLKTGSVVCNVTLIITNSFLIKVVCVACVRCVSTSIFTVYNWPVVVVWCVDRGANRRILAWFEKAKLLINPCAGPGISSRSDLITDMFLWFE